jgi:tetratricopeptide (TPR) repeat protein
MKHLNIYLILIISVLIFSCSSGEEERINSLFDKATKSFKDGDATLAEQRLEDIIINYPDNKSKAMGVVFSSYGYSHDRKGNKSQGLKYYLKALPIKELHDDKSSLARTYVNIGSLFQNKCSYTKAMKFYRKALNTLDSNEFKNEYYEIIFNIGLSYYHIKKFNLAKEHIERAIIGMENPSAIANGHRNLALVYYYMGVFEKCIEELEESVNIPSSQLSEYDIFCYHYNSADLYLGMENIEKAFEHSIKAYRVGIRENSVEYADIVHLLGCVYAKKGLIDSAEKFLDNSIIAYKNLGQLESLCVSYEEKRELYLAYKPNSSVDYGDTVELYYDANMIRTRSELDSMVTQLVEYEADLKSEKNKSSNLMTYLISSFIIIALLTFLFYRERVHKLRKTKDLNIKIEAENKINLVKDLNGQIIKEFISIRELFMEVKATSSNANLSQAQRERINDTGTAIEGKFNNILEKAKEAEAVKIVATADPITEISNFRYDDSYNPPRVYFDRPSGDTAVNISIENYGQHIVEGGADYLEIELSSGEYGTKGQTSEEGGGWGAWGSEEEMVVN